MRGEARRGEEKRGEERGERRRDEKEERRSREFIRDVGSESCRESVPNMRELGR